MLFKRGIKPFRVYSQYIPFQRILKGKQRCHILYCFLSLRALLVSFLFPPNHYKSKPALIFHLRFNLQSVFSPNLLTTPIPGISGMLIHQGHSVSFFVKSAGNSIEARALFYISMLLRLLASTIHSFLASSPSVSLVCSSLCALFLGPFQELFLIFLLPSFFFFFFL